jgi:hypothetical protein
MFSTGAFIILTFPASLITGYYYVELVETELGQIVLIILDDLTYFNHSLINFLLLMLNKQIFNEFKRMILTIKKLICSN